MVASAAAKKDKVPQSKIVKSYKLSDLRRADVRENLFSGSRFLTINSVNAMTGKPRTILIPKPELKRWKMHEANIDQCIREGVYGEFMLKKATDRVFLVQPPYKVGLHNMSEDGKSKGEHFLYSFPYTF